MEPEGLEAGEHRLDQESPVPGGDVVVELLLHDAFAHVHADALLHEILQCLGAAVEHDTVGDVNAPHAGFLDLHAEDVLIGLLIGAETGADVLESDELADLRVAHGDLVVHLPHETDGKTYLVVRIVGGFWPSAGDPHIVLFEGLYKFTEGIIGTEHVVGIEHDDDVRGLIVEITVDGGILTFPLLLSQKSDSREFLGQFRHDLVGTVGASGRDHQYLSDTNPSLILRENGAYGTFYDLFLVVRTNPDGDWKVCQG